MTLSDGGGVASILAVTLVVAGLSWSLAEGWRRWALRSGVLDQPGHRSSHALATPRGAGVGIVAAIVAGAWLSLPPGAARDGVLLSIVAAGVVGLVDDLRPLAPSVKLSGQAIAALPLALVLPLPLDALGIDRSLVPFDGVGGHAAAFALALLYVNAWNFMDGIDGLAASAAAAVAAGAWWAASAAGAAGPWLAPLLLAASVGFLPVNLRRAKAFMGDCGSHALGMGVAALVLGVDGGEGVWVAVAASGAFLVDVLGTLVLRVRDGERLSTAHRRHLYQLVIRSGYSHARVTTAYAAWMLASGGVVAIAQSAGAEGPAAMAILAVTAVAWMGLVRHFGSVLRSKEGR